MSGLVPCSAAEAVQRMLAIEGQGGQYIWGTGNYNAHGIVDLPWTANDKGEVGSDCAGAAVCYAYKLTRHRPGFNKQPRATIEDDINVDSIIEDADPERGGHQELGELVYTPAPGILVLTPTIHLPGRVPPFMEPGHVRLIIGVAPGPWDPDKPTFSMVTWLECHGPPRHKPGITRATGESVDHWNEKWPLPHHRAVMVRIRARS